jgi:hypothetical protein
VLELEIKQGKIIDFADFVPLFERFIADVLHVMPCGGKLKGQSRKGAFYSEYTEKRAVSMEALALFCMRTSKSVTIKRNGVYDSGIGQSYWGEWMAAAKGTKVYMRRDPKNYQEAYVFDDATDKYLGKAAMGVFSAPAFATTQAGKEQLAAAYRTKINAGKQINTLIKRVATAHEVVLERMAVGFASMNQATVAESDPVIVQMMNTEMDQVVREAQAEATRGQVDLSPYYRPEKPKKRIYKLFENE